MSLSESENKSSDSKRRRLPPPCTRQLSKDIPPFFLRGCDSKSHERLVVQRETPTDLDLFSPTLTTCRPRISLPEDAHTLRHSSFVNSFCCSFRSRFFFASNSLNFSFSSFWFFFRCLSSSSFSFSRLFRCSFVEKFPSGDQQYKPQSGLRAEK